MLERDVSKRNLKEFTIASKRLNISRFAAQNWLDWRDVHCDGQMSTRRSLLLSIAWRVRQISEILVYQTEQIKKKCTHETPIRIPRSPYKYERSPPWIWRRATWTDCPLSIPIVAFVVFIIQYLMVAAEWTLVWAHKLKIVNDLWAHAMSSLKELRDLFWMLIHSSRNSEWNFDKILEFVVVRSFTADSNPLQPTEHVNRTPSDVTFSRVLHTLISMSHVTLTQDVLHASRHVITRLVVRLIWYSSTLYSAFFTVSRIFLFILLFIFIFHVGWFDEKSHAYFREWGEELGTLAENNPLRSYEPNFIDNYHISETTEISIQESSSESKPSNLHDLEFDDYTIGRALSSPLFQEREDPANSRQVYHSPDEKSLSSQSSSVGHVRTRRPVFDEFGSLISNVRAKPRRDSEIGKSRFFWSDNKERNLADYRAEIE